MTLSSSDSGPAPAALPLPRQCYAVLYYKRTNKVHKHRGTTRQDGILSIASPPKCEVVLVAKNDDRDDAEEDIDDGGEEDCVGKLRRGNKKRKRLKKERSAPPEKPGSCGVVIYRGVNLELAKRAFSSVGIEADEEIVLNGQWECQIVSRASATASDNDDNQDEDGCALAMTSSTIRTNNKSSTAANLKNPLLKHGSLIGGVGLTSSSSRGIVNNRNLLHSGKNHYNASFNSSSNITYKLLLGKQGGFKPPPSTSNNNAVSASSSSSSATITTTSASTASVLPLPYASGKMTKDKNGEWYLDKTTSNYHDDEAPTTLLREDFPSSLVRGPPDKTTTVGSGWMRKRLPGNKSLGRGSIRSIRGGIMKRISSQSPPLPPHVKSATGTTSSSTTATLIIAPNNITGALGDQIQVPHSIREILRPHQREGIAFLWNCVTGVSPGLNNAIMKAKAASAAAASCSSSLSSMSSFDLEDEDILGNVADDNDDECGGNLSLQGNDAAKKMICEDTMPKGAVLADEMGLGKTLMTIATIFALHRRQRDRRFIVVCPSSLVSNWAKEFDKWIGKASQPKRVIVRNGNEEGLRKLRSFVPIKPQQSEVLILSYELFRLHVKVFCNAAKIGLLVVDEGHRLKNSAGSQTLSALNSISAEARILITGTPIQNNLSEFYTIANFVIPGILGDLNTFRRLYEHPMSRANQKNATLDQKEKCRQKSKLLDNITSTFVLRRLQKDILKSILPPRKEILLFCRPTERQCQIYNSISTRASESFAGIDDNNPLMLLTEARKLCAHPSLVSLEVADSSLELSGKMIVLSSLLDSIRKNNPADKVVIISNFTSALSIIEDSILRKKNMPFVRLDGSTDNASRGPLVDSFNNRSVDHSFAFMLSSKAGGCGLNLIGANRLIMVDADWNPATDHQSMARIYRQGQTKPCFVYRLFTTGTVEEIIYQRQIHKGNLAKIANDGGSNNIRSVGASFTKEELRDCFTLKEGCICDTKKKLGKQWSGYDGADSLRDHGCLDEPLLEICGDKALSFVHLVEEEAYPVDLDDDDTKEEDVDDVTRDEVSLGLGAESSSEEEEFDS